MADKDFIGKKLVLLSRDKQRIFDRLAKPLQDMAKRGEHQNTVRVPMEGLGYIHVEAFDTGHPKGQWADVAVHWCKLRTDLRG